MNKQVKHLKIISALQLVLLLVVTSIAFQSLRAESFARNSLNNINEQTKNISTQICTELKKVECSIVKSTWQMNEVTKTLLSNNSKEGL